VFMSILDGSPPIGRVSQSPLPMAVLPLPLRCNIRPFPSALLDRHYDRRWMITSMQDRGMGDLSLVAFV
jgi:hypothetical protein